MQVLGFVRQVKVVLYRFLKSFIYAVSGIAYCVKTQRNMRLHLLAATAVLIFSFHINLPAGNLVLVFFAMFGVVIAEMFNTSVESLADAFTKEYHGKVKIAKDVAAGAVLLAAVNALVTGYLILWPYFYSMVKLYLNRF